MTNPLTEPRKIQTPDGRSLDLYVAGPDDGEALISYPGSPCSGQLGRSLVEAAADRGMRTVAWSRPGYGSSSRLPGRSVADVVLDTVTVLDYLGAQRCHAIGDSGGGPHVLAAAALLPERVRAVATIGSVAPYPADGLDWTAGMGAENIEEFAYAMAGADALLPRMEAARAPWVAVTGDQVVAAFGDLVDGADRAVLVGELAEEVASTFREALREGYWGWFDDDLAFVGPWGFDVASIRIPVHVWQGRHDRMVPYSHGEWLASHIPTACAHLSEHDGHLSFENSMPEIVNELIAAV